MLGVLGGIGSSRLFFNSCDSLFFPLLAWLVRDGHDDHDDSMHDARESRESLRRTDGQNEDGRKTTQYFDSTRGKYLAT